MDMKTRRKVSVVNYVLHVRRGSQLSRSLLTLSLFVMKAGMHVLCTKLKARNRDTSYVVRWICLISVGVVVEDYVTGTGKIHKWAGYWTEEQAGMLMMNCI